MSTFSTEDRSSVPAGGWVTAKTRGGTMVLQTLDKQLRDAEAALELAKEREVELANRPKVRAAAEATA